MLVKRYTFYFIFFIVFITAILSAFNYFIDPYMIFQSKRIPGLNNKKPAAANRSAQYKPYNVINIKPKTIVVGNSRPEMGIDPNSSCWPEGSGIIYSLTFPGKSVYNQTLAVFHAVSNGQVQNILLAVDFIDFLHNKRNVEKEFWPKYNSEFTNRLLVDENMQENKGYRLNKIKDFSVALFSLNALNDSFYTLMSQSSNSQDRTYLGFNPAKDFLETIRYEGARVLFKQKQTKLKKIFSKTGLSIYDLNQWSVEIEAVKRVIQLAIDKKIALTLFINPYHYTYLETILRSGYWVEFENFKKSLVQVVKQYGNKQVMLWDFSLYSNYTVSAVPNQSNIVKNSNWFWEPAHYKSELGEVMLDEMFGQNCIKNKMGSLGIKLNDENITAHLIRQNEQRLILLQQLSINTDVSK